MQPRPPLRVGPGRAVVASALMRAAAAMLPPQQIIANAGLLARVQSDAHLNWLPGVTAIVSNEAVLNGYGTLNIHPSRLEGEHEAIAGRLNLPPTNTRYPPIKRVTPLGVSR